MIKQANKSFKAWISEPKSSICSQTERFDKKIKAKRSREILKIWVFVALTLGLISILLFSLNSNAGSISVIDGTIYSTQLNSLGPTNSWGGDKGTINNNPVEISRKPFFAKYILSADIVTDSLPGGNLNMNKYNLVVMGTNTTFNMNNVENTTYTDLYEGVLFPSSLYSGKDNPQNTFDCSNRATFQIGGKNFSGCRANLLNNIVMGLLKYKVSGSKYLPLFIVDTSNLICYDNNACNFEFLLPINSTIPYYYYYISKLPEYSIRVWIDSVERDDFETTALPYYVKTEVVDYYTGDPIPNVNVAVTENNGNAIFVPFRLEGIVSESTSMTKTNSTGEAMFIIAPTDYQTPDYSINVSVIVDNEVAKTKALTVDDASSAPQEKKLLSPSLLLDNARVNVNAMNQITNSLYIWANTLREAKFFDMTVYKNGSISPSNINLQTGAPNVITVHLKDSNGQEVNGYVSTMENNGYLIMNPVYNSTNLGYKEHIDKMEEIPTGTQFVITPTSYGTINSNITLSVYDNNHNLIKNIQLSVNPALEPRAGQSYNNDEMKTTINAMNVVLNSLYYSLN